MKPPLPRSATLALLTGALGLPVALVVVYAASLLLGALGDSAGSAVLLRIAQAGGILWVIDIIFLVIVQAIATPTDP